MRRLIFISVCLVSSVGLSTDMLLLSQDPLTEEALFHRCYAHITRLAAPFDNPELLAVKAGRRASAACMNVLDKAILDTSGRLSGTPATNAEGVSVLNNFFAFHRGWFQVLDLSGKPITPDSSPERIEITEPALHITRALFQPGVPFSEIVTGKSALRALRTLGSYEVDSDENGNDKKMYAVAGEPLAGLQYGELIGIHRWGEGNKTYYTRIGTPVDQVSYRTATCKTEFPNCDRKTISEVNFTYTNWDAYQSYGGGLLGTQAYLMMNSGFPTVGYSEDYVSPNEELVDGNIIARIDHTIKGVLFKKGVFLRKAKDESQINVSNASVRMHRRWAKHILNDLLCRPLPALRVSDMIEDVAAYRAKYTENQRLGFRDGETCMSCHGTLDNLAATARNIHFWFSNNNVDWNGDGSFLFGTNDVYRDHRTFAVSATVNQPEETDPLHLLKRDVQYYKRPNKGVLRYRDFRGFPHNDTIPASTTIYKFEKLGEMLAQKDDLYVCAASRYFQHFTGIEANLQDPEDPNNPRLSADDQHYRDEVIRLGMRLKEHKSLRQLIQEIIESDIYAKSGMRDMLQ